MTHNSAGEQTSNFDVYDDFDHPVLALLMLAVGAELDFETRKFLALSLERWVRSDGRVNLENALGLRQRGGVSFGRALKLARRDQMLCRLWKLVPEWADLTAAAAARLMVRDAKRYQSGRWLREKNFISAPSSEPAATWWLILQDGLALPGERRVLQVLEAEIQ